MSRYLYAAIAVAAAIVVALCIVGNDAVDYDDDGTDDGHGTVAEGGFYQWPSVNNSEWGTLVDGGYDSTYIYIRAVPEDGYMFLNWTYEGTDDVYSVLDTIAVTLDDTTRLTANFGEVGGKVISVDWEMPVFTEDGISDVLAQETYDSAISAEEYMASMSDPSIPRQSGAGASIGDMAIADGQSLAIAGYLDGLTVGMTNLQRAIVLMYFVQDAVYYTTDMDLYHHDEWWAAPVETMWNGMGDCEDSAALYVSVGAIMGLDVGFVAFDYVNAGHMSAAVALQDGEGVSGQGVTTFTIDGTTYLYVETADNDSSGIRPAPGYLMSPYMIGNGRFTPVSYSEEDGFSYEDLGIISGIAGARSVGHVYGTRTDDTAVNTMNVGDTYIYAVQLPFESDVVVMGDALRSEGGFLNWDGETKTLVGTADRAGTFSITLTALSSESGIAVMDMVFEVRDGTDGSWDSDYQSGTWTVVGEGGAVAGGDEAVSLPPVVPMAVGDSFTYTAEVSLNGSSIAVVGGALSDYGGFLGWDGDAMTMSGTVSEPGTYRAVLTAYWSSGTGVYQTAYQVVTLEVSESDGSAPSDIGLVYDRQTGDWTLIGTEGPADSWDEGDGGGDLLVYVVAIAAVVAVGLFVARRFL